jgi:hypothetical protein
MKTETNKTPWYPNEDCMRVTLTQEEIESLAKVCRSQCKKRPATDTGINTSRARFSVYTTWIHVGIRVDVKDNFTSEWFDISDYGKM